MTERREYCIEDCCEDPDNPGFPLPTWGHGERCEAHTKQWTRHGKCTPIKPKLTPKARFLEACIRLTEAEEDSDHNSALRTAWEIPKQEALKNLSDKEIEKLAREMLSRRIKSSLARARKEGKRIGRKPKLNDERLAQLLEVGLKPKQIARSEGVSERTVWRALTKRRVLSVRDADAPAARPRAS